jgi:hypothetical protein
MPLYEAQGFALAKRSSLTPQQQLEQHAALFGVPLERKHPPMQALTPEQASALNLTPEQVENMRELVLQHDAARSNETREFDLNKPNTPPYKHQEFPTTVYQHAKGKNRIVKNAAELERALAAGWDRKPAPPVVAAAAAPVPEIDADDEPEEIIAVIAAEKPRAKRAAR